MPGGQIEVMPRSVWPSWRCMTRTGTPSWAISTAGVPRQVRREATAYPGRRSGVAELRSGGGR
jgi:hypothetical protein